jgi:hypothetical protein
MFFNASKPLARKDRDIAMPQKFICCCTTKTKKFAIFTLIQAQNRNQSERSKYWYHGSQLLLPDKHLPCGALATMI